MHFTKKLLFLFIFSGYFIIYAQESKVKEVLNIFTFEEVEELHQKKPKPILIFIYTDWCKICFGMKKTTFKNKKVIQLLNEKFYFITLNGEEKKDINFLGKNFVYKPSGSKTGTHEITAQLATIKNKISYPTTTILNNKFEIDLQVNSFLNSKQLLKIINTYNNQ